MVVNIVTLVLGLIALAVIIFVTMKYHKKWKEEKRRGKKIASKGKTGNKRDSLF